MGKLYYYGEGLGEKVLVVFFFVCLFVCFCFCLFFFLGGGGGGGKLPLGLIPGHNITMLQLTARQAAVSAISCTLYLQVRSPNSSNSVFQHGGLNNYFQVHADIVTRSVAIGHTVECLGL